MELSTLQPIKPAPVSPLSGASAAQGGAASLSPEEQALKGGDGAKIAGISLSDVSKTANNGGVSPMGTQASLGGFVEGKLALDVIDAVLPAIVVILFAYAKITVKKSDFQLTAKEKDTLTPLVQKCMDSLMINFNSPWTALAVTAIGIYGAKIGEHGFKAVIEKKAVDKAAKDQQKDKPVGEGTGNPDTGLKPWGEEEVRKVLAKRRKGVEEAKQWLTDNWVKMGGVLDFKKAKLAAI